mmetsp:Transcript_9263/g.27831  ORF Transcript_9263/g.27831 Transcript_9263/m.27831 type:complete len:241 (+) Transcript_9263:750-1472(+)
MRTSPSAESFWHWQSAWACPPVRWCSICPRWCVQSEQLGAQIMRDICRGQEQRWWCTGCTVNFRRAACPQWPRDSLLSWCATPTQKLQRRWRPGERTVETRQQWQPASPPAGARARLPLPGACLPPPQLLRLSRGPAPASHMLLHPWPQPLAAPAVLARRLAQRQVPHPGTQPPPPVVELKSAPHLLQRHVRKQQLQPWHARGQIGHLQLMVRLPLATALHQRPQAESAMLLHLPMRSWR